MSAAIRAQRSSGSSTNAGRLTEVGYLNGEIVQLAESLGTASLARPLLRGLAAAGYKVGVVGDLAAAESALSSGRWDAVLASRAFDGGEASSLTQRMRRAGRVMPVAAVGEQFSTADQVALLSAGLDPVFTVEPMWELVVRPSCGR
jgi:hypothetical protein